MSKLKTLLLLFTLVLTFITCNRDEDKPQNPTVTPPPAITPPVETDLTKDIVGYYVDNLTSDPDDKLQINVTRVDNTHVSITIVQTNPSGSYYTNRTFNYVEMLTTSTFKLNEVSVYEFCESKPNRYKGTGAIVGSVISISVNLISCISGNDVGADIYAAPKLSGNTQALVPKDLTTKMVGIYKDTYNTKNIITISKVDDTHVKVLVDRDLDYNFNNAEMTSEGTIKLNSIRNLNSSSSTCLAEGNVELSADGSEILLELENAGSCKSNLITIYRGKRFTS